MCQQYDSNNGLSTGGTAAPKWQMTIILIKSNLQHVDTDDHSGKGYISRAPCPTCMSCKSEVVLLQCVWFCVDLKVCHKVVLIQHFQLALLEFICALTQQ